MFISYPLNPQLAHELQNKESLVACLNGQLSHTKSQLDAEQSKSTQLKNELEKTQMESNDMVNKMEKLTQDYRKLQVWCFCFG